MAHPITKLTLCFLLCSTIGWTQTLAQNSSSWETRTAPSMHGNINQSITYVDTLPCGKPLPSCNPQTSWWGQRPHSPMRRPASQTWPRLSFSPTHRATTSRGDGRTHKPSLQHRSWLRAIPATSCTTLWTVAPTRRYGMMKRGKRYRQGHAVHSGRSQATGPMKRSHERIHNH